METLRVLFLLRHFPPELSGPATQMGNLVRVLKHRKDLEVYVVRAARPGEKKPEEVDELLPWSMFIADKLEKIKRKFHPDIVHLDSIYPAAPAALRVFKKEKKVITLGGLIFKELLDYHRYVRKNPVLDFFKGLFLYIMARAVLPRFDMITVNGEDIVEHLKSHGIPEAKIHIVRNGILLKPFTFCPSYSKKVAFIGRLSWELGVLDVLDAAEMLKDFEFYIAGDGPLKKEILDKIREKRLKNVRYLGKVPHENIPELLCKVSFLLLPYRRIGGIPHVVLEGMAAGKVILARKRGSLTRVITPNKDGFFFEDIEEAAEILKHLTAETAQFIGKNARKTVEEKYNLEKEAEKLVRLYRSL